MQHKILSKTTTLHCHAFTVEKVYLRLPDGRERDYDLVNHKDAVTLLPIDASGNVYFVSQFRVGAEKVMLELPAGVMDAGEMPEVSARRELREETGMDCAELIPLGGFYMAAGYTTEYMHVFLAAGLVESPLQQDDDEFLELSRIPLRKCIELIHNGGIQDGKTLSAFMMALPSLQEMFPKMFYKD